MAIFRKVHTAFWSDVFTCELDNDHKLFYLYLITNERTKQCGIYEISKKQISFDLGYSIDRVSTLLKYFIKSGKIMYNEDTKEIALKNWGKFNYSSSPKVVKCIESELKNVKDTLLIQYVRGMYTLSQEEEEEEQEQESEKKKIEPIDFEKLLIFVNSSFGKNFKVVSKVVKDKFKARIKEGYSNIQIKDCIEGLKNDEWHKSIGYNPVTLEYISRSATIDKYSTKSTVQPTEEDGNDDYYRNVMAQVNKYKEQ